MEAYSRKVSSTSGMEKEILGQIQALEMCSPRDEGAHRPTGKNAREQAVTSIPKAPGILGGREYSAGIA